MRDVPPGSAAQNTLARSACYGVTDGSLVKIRAAETRAEPIAVLLHAQFRAMMLSGAYPCLGGASAVRNGSYRFALYCDLGSPAAVRDCAHDLNLFLRDTPADAQPVAVLVAVFVGHLPGGEIGFEEALWRQLQQMHRLEAAWAGRPAPSPIRTDESDESDPGFFFGDREFFVVGLHPSASRWARRFSWPTLIFNALTHEAVLQRRGQYERMQHAVRRRDRLLQGSVNPAIDLPQLAQFSGRAVDTGWECLKGITNNNARRHEFPGQPEFPGHRGVDRA